MQDAKSNKRSNVSLENEMEAEIMNSLIFENRKPNRFFKNPTKPNKSQKTLIMIMIMI